MNERKFNASLSQISAQTGIILAMPSRGERNESPVGVLLVDDDAMFRRAARDLLEAAGFRIVGEASRADQAIALALDLTPDVVVTAVGLRGISGIEATRRIRESLPEARVLMLTKSRESADMDAAIHAGAGGYMLKGDPPEKIVAAVRAAAAGEAPLSPHVASMLIGRLQTESSNGAKPPEFTARERSVLELLAAGRRNAEIAESLSISVNTVKRHVSNLLAKLGVENRTQAAVEATRRGLP